ncbi:type VI secretion system ATPase TssH [Serratia sp. M24T3]|uniref:type VI secretion system ATPase TssH n=1 Tax=Serratia sp. M24T3 TaxID=932213 RepID=UPI00025B9031|nr:type VI secretion system ATPase TssH [Serratia sp. M24T3]EIC86601.1 Clp ATPase [Serratia sp. M24T3]
MENQSADLLRRLNPYCAKALEAAATLCHNRAHAEITIEHWLLKLLELGEGDITVLARRYEWNMDNLWQNLLTHLDQLAHSINSPPILSESLNALMQSAWLTASLQDNAKHIRSIHLLKALVSQPQLLRSEGTWPLFSLSSAQITRLLPLLNQQSDERPELQQPADLIVPFASQHELSPHTSINRLNLNESHQAVLNKFTVDITAKAKAGQIDPIFGRDTEIRQMIDILSRRRKNNPILVGEPGVGKTALVEGLALRIIEGNVPESLKSISLRTLDLGLLQAGAGVKGEFEQRLKNVIEAVQQSPAPILLFIDEAHTIIGAGNLAGGADAANLLKPALARGELRTIAATTWSEYKQYFERDAALERRFQIVKVDEPDDAKASMMLRGLKSRYAQHHCVNILDNAIIAAINLSRRFLTGRQLPDKAIDLLDTAGARVRMSIDAQPEALTQINSGLAALEMERQAIEQDKRLMPDRGCSRLKEIDQRHMELTIEQQTAEQQYKEEKRLISLIIEARKQPADTGILKKLQQQLSDTQGNNPLLSLDVDARTVATVIADWTGIPLGSLLKDEQSDLLLLESHLAEIVIGQDAALTAMAQRLRAAKTGLTSEKGPLGVFLLVGPSGVGKTKTAAALAETLFGGQKSLITINMSEYQEAHTVSQLKGSPPGYVGYGQGGILTEAVRKRPYSVVLLDEVEKAHSDVINLFFQVFDRGIMRDGEGREIDFRNTVILMTANLGSDRLMQRLDDQPESTHSNLHELIHPILRNHFQPALLARFQTLIYRPLNADALRNIAEIKLRQVTKRLNKHYGLQCIIQDRLYDTLVAACLLPDAGARNINSLLNQQILPVLSQQLLSRKPTQWKSSLLTLGWCEKQGITLEFENQSENM